MATVIASVLIGVATGPAGAVSCTSGQEPFLALSQSVTTSNGNVSYDLVVTNTGDCGATDIVVTVSLPAGSTFLGFRGVVRSWSCTATPAATPPQTVTCPLQSQLDQRGTNGGSPSGTAEVVVTATAVSGGNKNAPPDTTEFASLTDAPQPFNGDADSLVAWGGVINPKTGGNLHIGNDSSIIGNELTGKENASVNIPAGVGAIVSLGQLTPLSNCSMPATNPHPCLADLSINAPALSKGFTTITLTFPVALFPSGPPPAPLYDEGNGPLPLLKCKGQTASPPCVYSFSLNNAGTAWILVIHDAGGTKYYG